MAFSALDSALTGPLFATAEMREVFSDRATVAAMLEVEAALADALAEAGLADEGLGAAVRSVTPDDFDLSALGDATALAGVPSIPFLAALEAKLPNDLRGLHRGATTQDLVDTALVLQLREALTLVEDDLAVVLLGLARLAERYAETPCAGRTYGQHAAPVTFGFKAAVWLAELAPFYDVCFTRCEHLEVSLDGAVGTRAAWGAGAELVVSRTADLLGLRHGVVAWHTRRSRLAQFGSSIATLLGALGKMAGDIAHLASSEVGEVAEPHVPGRGGSSAMPHKRNPVGCTVILAAASAAKGHVVTLLDSMVAAHERPAGAWHAEWHALPQLFGLVSGALREARILACNLVIDERRMAANLALTRGLLYADRAAAALAPSLGRARAHGVLEAASAKVRDGHHSSLLDALRADPDAATSGDDVLRVAFDPAPATAAGAAATRRVLASWAGLLDMLRDRYAI